MYFKNLTISNALMQIKRIFSWINKTDDSYREMCKTYTKIDGIVMLIFFALQFGILTLAVYIMIHFRNLFVAVSVPLIITTVNIIIVKARKQSLATIGFTKKNFFISFLAGLCFGAVVFIFSGNWRLFSVIIQFDRGIFSLVTRFIYFLVVISLYEEVLIRGYVQTRMSSLIKNYLLSTLIVGALFGISHLPIHLISGRNFLSFFTPDSMNFFWRMVIFHLIFNFLYRRYNSLVAPVMFHTLYNFNTAVQLLVFNPEWWN